MTKIEADFVDGLAEFVVELDIDVADVLLGGASGFESDIESFVDGDKLAGVWSGGRASGSVGRFVGGRVNRVGNYDVFDFVTIYEFFGVAIVAAIRNGVFVFVAHGFDQDDGEQGNNDNADNNKASADDFVGV